MGGVFESPDISVWLASALSPSVRGSYGVEEKQRAQQVDRQTDTTVGQGLRDWPGGGRHSAQEGRLKAAAKLTSWDSVGAAPGQHVGQDRCV